MESLTNKLAEIVSKEVKQFEQFLQLLIDQQNYLVENDLDNLTRVVEEQEKEILATRELEKSRLRVIAEISERLERDPNDLTLSRITKRLAKPQAEKLEKMHRTLQDLHAKINKVKSKNEFLIKKSMEYIEGTVRLLASGGDAQPTYQESNGSEKKPSSIAVNRTV